MNKLTKLFCRMVLYLEYIPAWRRTCRIRLDENGKMVKGPWEWKYMKRGLWGFYLLDSLGLFHKYIDTTDWEEVDEPS